ncbi:magnesium chelatase [Sulfobacillus thermotolerans]|uniref:Magnesium chelatase n=1 Tax=Sulfobacillus thermotolerans TaxID=338644 RepID=A0ABM6RNE1_9FIRM|nr:magnesium chelatase [Sulfobacillus thermotolerans]
MSPQQLLDKLTGYVVGKRQPALWTVSALVAGGHILIEDVPGVAKTRLARTLARLLDLSYARIQATPDVLPSDITGAMIYDPSNQTMTFRQGPIFHQVVLVDEINRATPRAQSALLEAMEDREVSADSETYSLPQPFFVMATANPVEMAGTFPLPEAQKDRFWLSFGLGYPTADEEFEILTRFSRNDTSDVPSPLASAADLLRWQDASQQVHISDDIVRYVVDIVQATREHPRISLGASPRAAVQWIRILRAYAWVQGRNYVIPDDVQVSLPVVLGHRLIVAGGIRGGTWGERQQAVRDVLNEIVAQIAVPVE